MIESRVLALEQTSGDLDSIHSIFRGFHTIKGLAGFLEFGAMQEVAHETETLLELARTGQLPGGPYSAGELRVGLAHKIRAAAERSISASLRAPIAIGASTGGTEAIQEVPMRLPAGIPGIVIARHIPAGFSRAFANRLNELRPMAVREAADGDQVRPGLALAAPGNYHMLAQRAGEGYRVVV